MPSLRRGLIIDPGCHNMGFYIEEFDIEKLKLIKTVPSTKRLTKNREATEDYKEFLEKIKLIGKRKYFAKVNLSENKGTKFDLQIFIKLSEFLESKKEIWNKCDFFLIEQQVKANPMAQRLEQHCISWFTIFYLTTKSIIVYPARHKYSLGCPKKIIDIKSKKERKIKPIERKKWASVEAKKILELRKDTVGLDYITNNIKKTDDISDCMITLTSFFIKCLDGEYLLD